MTLLHRLACARRVAALALAGSSLALAACRDGSTSPSSRTTVTAAEVTPDVAASIAPDGHFMLAPQATMPVGEVREDQARLIAARFVKDVAPLALSRWEREVGGPIDPSQLAPCDRAVYAATPYENVTTLGLSEIARRTFDSHWIVPMCDRAGTTTLVVTFSSLATELDAAAAQVGWARAEASSHGIPASTDATVFSPEGAVRFAFGKTGARISGIPSLVMSPMPNDPSLVRWQVKLEHATHVTGAKSGAARDRSQLQVGFADSYSASGLLDQNAVAPALQTTWTDPATQKPFTLVLKAGVPAGVELVTVTP